MKRGTSVMTGNQYAPRISVTTRLDNFWHGVKLSHELVSGQVYLQ